MLMLRWTQLYKLKLSIWDNLFISREIKHCLVFIIIFHLKNNYDFFGSIIHLSKDMKSCWCTCYENMFIIYLLIIFTFYFYYHFFLNISLEVKYKTLSIHCPNPQSPGIDFVYTHKILSSKVDPCIERVKIFIMDVDLWTYFNEAEKN